MKTILWTQNESPETPPTILVDGLRKDGDAASEAYATLISWCEKVPIKKSVQKSLIHAGVSSHFAILNPSPTIFYLQGSFQECDEAGRKMPYMFYCEGVDTASEAFKHLKELAGKISRTCNPIEEEKANKCDEQQKKSALIALGVKILCVIFLILFGILWITN